MRRTFLTQDVRTVLEEKGSALDVTIQDPDGGKCCLSFSTNQVEDLVDWARRALAEESSFFNGTNGALILMTEGRPFLTAIGFNDERKVGETRMFELIRELREDFCLQDRILEEWLRDFPQMIEAMIGPDC